MAAEVGMIRDQRQPNGSSETSGSVAGSLGPGKRTLTESLPDQQFATQVPGGRAPGKQTLTGATPAPAAAAIGSAQPASMWEHTFGEASTPVGKLGRVQAPRGVYLRTRPLPGADSPAAPIFEERQTLPAEELGRLINPGHKGNLHDQAWDIADQLVARMRKEGHR
jgi:hypothetical protein